MSRWRIFAVFSVKRVYFSVFFLLLFGCLVADVSFGANPGSSSSLPSSSSVISGSAVAVKAPSSALRVLLVGAEAALDPALATDLQSLSIIENLFDSMLRYDYLARPVRLQANTLLAMPEISEEGRRYVMKIKPGIYFAPDPAFHGQRRELTAQDYVYSLTRLLDPALASPWRFLVADKLVGTEALQFAPPTHSLRSSWRADLPVAGIVALDRYTLQLRLKQADPNFLFQLAMPATSAVAREVVEAYPGESGNHPVGTGPFRMGQWQRSFKMELLANPAYHGRFSSVLGVNKQAASPGDLALAAHLQGKKLPLVDRVEVTIVEELQSRVLGLMRGDVDYLEQVPPSLSGMLLTSGQQGKRQLKPEFTRKGMQLALFSPMQTYYLWMNMNDPVVGGYSPDKIALRRAIALSYDRGEDIRLQEQGLALPAQSPLPPDVLGYDPDYRSPVQFNVPLANALLDKFGYVMHDGYRTMPDGQALQLVMHTLASAAGRLRDEVWRNSLKSVGIQVTFKSETKNDMLKAARLGKVQMAEANWVADYPDGDNFFQLLYGPNSGGPNYAHFNLPAYNALYEESRLLADSPERQRHYHAMEQLIHGYNPWVLLVHPLSADVWHPWLKNYKRHPVEFTAWRYLEVAPHTVP